MSRLNSVLISLFINETGKVATYHKEGAVYHTLDYVNWLEDRVAGPAESAQKAPNNARDEICSDDICEYCEGCSTMPSCKDYSEFKGRKLSPVA